MKKNIRFHGTSLRILVGIVGSIYLLLLIVSSVAAFIMSDSQNKPFSVMLFRWVAVSTVVAISLIVALFAAIRKEYVEVRDEGLVFRNSKEDWWCPWSSVTGIEERTYQGTVGRPFVCHVVKTPEREFCFGHTYLPDEWLPPDLRPGHQTRIYVGIERPTELLDRIRVRLGTAHSTGRSWSAEGPRPPREVAVLSSESGWKLGLGDWVLAIVLSVMWPALMVLAACWELPWSAPPAELDGTLTFRFSVLGQLRAGGQYLLLFPVAFSLLALGLVAFGSYVSTIRARLLGWTLFVLAGITATVISGWFLVHGYSSDYEVVLTADRLEEYGGRARDQDAWGGPSFSDQRVPAKMTAVIAWDEVDIACVNSNIRRNERLYVKSIRADRELLEEARKQDAPRFESGYLVIAGKERYVRISNTLDGFPGLVQEVITRAGLVRQQ